MFAPFSELSGPGLVNVDAHRWFYSEAPARASLGIVLGIGLVDSLPRKGLVYYVEETLKD